MYYFITLTNPLNYTFILFLHHFIPTYNHLVHITPYIIYNQPKSLKYLTPKTMIHYHKINQSWFFSTKTLINTLYLILNTYLL